MNAPIVLLTYNRPEHTLRTLTSLAKSEEANHTRVCIYSDGAKSNDDLEAVEAVRKICEQAKDMGFGSVELTKRESNIGLARNVIEGVGETIEKHGSVIVIEDDLTVSPFFIRYMNSALNFYDNMGIFSISGYSPDIEIPQDYQFSTYMMHRNCSWGWATWKKCWDKVDWHVSDFGQFIRDSTLRKEFNLFGDDLTPMLLKQQTGEIDSWSIRFCYAAFRAGQPTVYPRKSLVRNNGADGTGSNVGQTKKYETPLAQNISLSAFATGVAANEEIRRQFKEKYDTSALRKLINWYKRTRYVLTNRA